MNIDSNDKLKLLERIIAYVNSLVYVVKYKVTYETTEHCTEECNIQLFKLTTSCLTRINREIHYIENTGVNFTYEQIMTYLIVFNINLDSCTFFRKDMSLEELELQLAIRGF